MYNNYHKRSLNKNLQQRKVNWAMVSCSFPVQFLWAKFSTPDVIQWKREAWIMVPISAFLWTRLSRLKPILCMTNEFDPKFPSDQMQPATKTFNKLQSGDANFYRRTYVIKVYRQNESTAHRLLREQILWWVYRILSPPPIKRRRSYQW